MTNARSETGSPSSPPSRSATVPDRRRPILGIELWSFAPGEAVDAFRELEDLSDRAAIIVAAAHLDDALRRRLAWALRVPNEDLERELFENQGPLATFSSRILMAHSIGLVSKAGRRDMDLVRNIRNDVAHKIAIRGFEDSQVKNRCLALSLIDRFVRFVPPLPMDADGFPTKEGMQSLTGPGSEKQGGLIFPGEDPLVMKDARTRFFLTLNICTSNLIAYMRGPESVRADIAEAF